MEKCLANQITMYADIGVKDVCNARNKRKNLESSIIEMRTALFKLAPYRDVVPLSVKRAIRDDIDEILEEEGLHVQQCYMCKGETLVELDSTVYTTCNFKRRNGKRCKKIICDKCKIADEYTSNVFYCDKCEHILCHEHADKSHKYCQCDNKKRRKK